MTSKDCIETSSLVNNEIALLSGLPPQILRSDRPRNGNNQWPIKAPKIEFISCKWPYMDRIRSFDTTIRIRVFPWRRILRFDGEWYNTIWELALHVRDRIVPYWENEPYPRGKTKRAGECGGFTTCLIMDTFPEHEAYWRKFLGALLTDPASWWRYDDHAMDFVPIAGTASGKLSGDARETR